MEKDQVYEFIGELPIALYSKKIQIDLTSLNAILSSKGCGYESNRGLARGVSSSYKYWESRDPVVHHAIAFTYVDRNGNLPWK